MARVFLVNPPSPEPVRTPLLAFCHLAASLRAGGHEVALLDASAPHAPHGHAEIAERVRAFAPDLVGLHLKTLHVQPAYALARALAGLPLVAGGPHATIVPDEPLAQGVRWVVRGEGEETLVELADVIDGRRAATEVAGLSWIDKGLVRHNPTRPFLMELDRLAPPLSALDLFDPSWYDARPVPGGMLAPAGILSSRGCPAACTFCSNDVTGRRFRYRSAVSVAAEVALLRERFGLIGFSFFDDSFAVGRRRVRELCTAIAGGFNARGVVVPYPGTEIYQRHHERFGFTGWWIREPPLAYAVFPTSWDDAEIRRAYAADAALDRNFFRHPPHRLERIRQALVRKAELTIGIQRRRPDPGIAAAPIGVPAAGAR